MKLHFDRTTGQRVPAAGDNTVYRTKFDAEALAFCLDIETGKVVNLHKTQEILFHVLPNGAKVVSRSEDTMPYFGRFLDPIELVDGVYEYMKHKYNYKLYGTVIDGVRMSATEKDQNGLTAVFLDFISSPENFQDTNFVFENNTKYTITANNIMTLKTEWVAFRRSFFS